MSVERRPAESEVNNAEVCFWVCNAAYYTACEHGGIVVLMRGSDNQRMR
jgi:hypothetical protein